MKTSPVQRLGRYTVRTVVNLGRFSVFSLQVVSISRHMPRRARRLMDEFYHIGVLSLPIVGVSGIFVGMMLGLQGYNTLIRFGAAESLGAVVGLSLIRELGPVLTALLVTGRAGSAIAAEISAMVATQQLDGLRMMSIDPLDLVIAPKSLAMIIAMPLLSALFIVLALLGGYIVGVIFLGIDGGSYVSSLESAITFGDDVLGSLIKALVFGVLVALIATYHGYTAEPHSAGVSRATTSTVVTASVATLIVDYIITALWGV